jgi:hypothetical protein
LFIISFLDIDFFSSIGKISHEPNSFFFDSIGFTICDEKYRVSVRIFDFITISKIWYLIVDEDFLGSIMIDEFIKHPGIFILSQ